MKKTYHVQLSIDDRVVFSEVLSGPVPARATISVGAFFCYVADTIARWSDTPISRAVDAAEAKYLRDCIRHK